MRAPARAADGHSQPAGDAGREGLCGLGRGLSFSEPPCPGLTTDRAAGAALRLLGQDYLQPPSWPSIQGSKPGCPAQGQPGTGSVTRTWTARDVTGRSWVRYGRGWQRGEGGGPLLAGLQEPPTPAQRGPKRKHRGDHFQPRLAKPPCPPHPHSKVCRPAAASSFWGSHGGQDGGAAAEGIPSTARAGLLAATMTMEFASNKDFGRDKVLGLWRGGGVLVPAARGLRPDFCTRHSACDS